VYNRYSMSQKNIRQKKLYQATETSHGTYIYASFTTLLNYLAARLFRLHQLYHTVLKNKECPDQYSELRLLINSGYGQDSKICAEKFTASLEESRKMPVGKRTKNKLRQKLSYLKKKTHKETK
jgi:hypothetical protein